MTLIDELAQKFNSDTILFIGSGASMNAGLPTWKELILWLRDYTLSLGGDIKVADDFLDSDDFLNSATALTDELYNSDKSLVDFFNDYSACSIFRDAEPKEIHSLISKLPTSAIITPNYDLLLEKTYKDRQLTVIHKGECKLLNEIKRSRLTDYIYKYHGCITKPENIVLGSTQYRSEIHGGGLDHDCLKNLIATKTFVFIGAGLDDPDFNHVRDSFIDRNESENLEFWAFLSNCEARIDYYKKNLGINLINYKSEGANHSDLLNKLEYLLLKIRYEDEETKRIKTPKQAANPLTENKNNNNTLLRAKLVKVNEEVIPLDEQILGFVAFFDTIDKAECFKYLSEYKKNKPEEINNRIDYLVNRNLLKQTENLLLPIKEPYSIQAAEIIENDIIEYLGR